MQASTWRQRPPRLRDNRRSVFIEYALIVAVFCAILLAIVIFARAIQTYHLADNATPETARYAIADGTTGTTGMNAASLPVASGNFTIIRRVMEA